jgi:hypothetical protein
MSDAEREAHRAIKAYASFIRGGPDREGSQTAMFLAVDAADACRRAAQEPVGEYWREAYARMAVDFDKLAGD